MKNLLLLSILAFFVAPDTSVRSEETDHQAPSGRKVVEGATPQAACLTKARPGTVALKVSDILDVVEGDSRYRTAAARNFEALASSKETTIEEREKLRKRLEEIKKEMRPLVDIMFDKIARERASAQKQFEKLISEGDRIQALLDRKTEATASEIQRYRFLNKTRQLTDKNQEHTEKFTALLKKEEDLIRKLKNEIQGNDSYRKLLEQLRVEKLAIHKRIWKLEDSRKLLLKSSLLPNAWEEAEAIANHGEIAIRQHEIEKLTQVRAIFEDPEEGETKSRITEYLGFGLAFGEESPPKAFESSITLLRKLVKESKTGKQHADQLKLLGRSAEALTRSIAELNDMEALERKQLADTNFQIREERNIASIREFLKANSTPELVFVVSVQESVPGHLFPDKVYAFLGEPKTRSRGPKILYVKSKGDDSSMIKIAQESSKTLLSDPRDISKETLFCDADFGRSK